MMIDWPDFHAWLKTRVGLQTAARRLTAARRVVEHRPDAEATRGSTRDIYVHASRDLNAYELERGLPATAPVGRLVEHHRAKHKLEAVSIDEDGYVRLAQVLVSDPDPAGCVIRIILKTGKRISDVLRTDAQAIASAMKRPDGLLLMVVKGNKTVTTTVDTCKEDWKLVLAGAMSHGASIARWVAPSGDGSPEAGHAAYQAVNRHLKQLGDRVELSGRVHLHRLRRTFIVRALTQNVAPHKVQKAVDQSSPMTLARYADEVRVDWTREAVEAAGRTKS